VRHGTIHLWRTTGQTRRGVCAGADDAIDFMRMKIDPRSDQEEVPAATGSVGTTSDARFGEVARATRSWPETASGPGFAVVL
jgi:hypothetical protein